MELTFVSRLLELLDKHGPLALSLVIFIFLYLWSDRKNRQDKKETTSQHIDERKEWNKTHRELTERSISANDNCTEAIREMTRVIAETKTTAERQSEKKT